MRDTKIGSGRTLARFARVEDGTVTVDWVVLTAALVGLSTSVLFTVDKGVLGLGEVIDDGLAGAEIVQLGVLGE
ncbi:hypothetical protein RGUI_3697 [Rhodovulum sp. P5]|nr:hypothetical protein RGUI_3697 [Rhodovulum sp. P5]